MNKICYLGLVAVFAAMFMASCGNKSGSFTDNDCDSIKYSTIKLSDSTSLTTNGRQCAMGVDITAEIPSDTTDSLQKLFVKHVLDMPDSLQTNEAVRQYASKVLHQFDYATSDQPEELNEDEVLFETVDSYNTNINIYVQYNRHGVITFCKVISVKKNNKVTSVKHRYYSFDTKSHQYLSLTKMFREDAVSALTKMIKTRLMESNNVKTAEQLIDLGYYNIDNLVVSRNFYFDENGINWSFLPNELAVYALGEPKVRLDFEEVLPLASDDSVLKRITD